MAVMLAMQVAHDSGTAAQRAHGAWSRVWCLAAIVIVALLLAERTTIAQGRIAGELPPPITTDHFERMVVRVLVTPPGFWSGTSPALGSDALAPEVRRVIETIEPAHNAYLGAWLALVDGDLERLKSSPVQLAKGGTLTQMLNHHRRSVSIRRRAIQLELQLIDAIAAAFPEAQRPRAEWMRRERWRERWAATYENHARLLTLDLHGIVDTLTSDEGERTKVEPLLAAHDSALLALFDRYDAKLTRRHELLIVALKVHEAELLAAIRSTPPDHERSRAIRRDAAAELEVRAPVLPTIASIEDLQRRTLKALLAALGPSTRHALIQAVLSKLHINAGPTASNASRFARYALAARHLQEQERAPLAASARSWQERDAALAVRHLEASERLSSALNSVPQESVDQELVRIASEEGDRLLVEREVLAQRFLGDSMACMGEPGAAAIGLRRTPGGAIDEAALQWNDPDPELVASSRPDPEIDAPSRAYDDGPIAIGSALPLAALLDRIADRSLDDASLERLRTVQVEFERIWAQRVMPLVTAAASDLALLALARPKTSADLAGPIEIVDRLTGIELRMEDEAWRLEVAHFEALERLLAETGGRWVIELRVLRLARLWSLFGGAQAANQSTDHWGTPRRINAAAVALDRSLADPLRAEVATSLLLHRNDLEQAFRERVDLERAERRAQRVVTLRLRVPTSDPMWRGEVDIWEESEEAREALRSIDARIEPVVRAALDAPSVAASDGRIDPALLAEFKGRIIRLLLPRLIDEAEMVAPLLDKLEQMPALTETERGAVDSIAREHRLTHGAATDAIVASALDCRAEEPGLSQRERSDRLWVCVRAIARWRFERDEANAKARMHLRNSLRREIIERVPALVSHAPR